MKYIAALWVIAVAVWLAAPAQATLGGEVPSPDTCDYPAVGHSGMYGGIVDVYIYVCDFPTEVNGAHHHCEYGGAVAQAQAGVSIMFFTANISGNVGVITGWCDWVCPDGWLSDAPNPPGGWKNYIIPRPCKSRAPPPPSPWATPDNPNPPPPEPPPPVDQTQPLVPTPWQPGLNPGLQTNPGSLPQIPQEPRH